MNEAELQKIVKIMMMTTSQFDQEALTAIRRVNQLLKLYKLSWGDILFIKNEQTKSSQARYRKTYFSEIIEEMDASDFQVNSWEFEFLNSIRVKHSLTAKQEQCFNNIKAKYEKFCKERQKC